MTTIITRAGKGSPLTNNEVDGNFVNLNTAKVEVAGTPADGQVIAWSAGTSSWTPVAAATGTVTSVAASGGTTGFTFTGSPVTTSGTLLLDGTLAVTHGGTGSTTASGARANLSAAVSGVNGDITSLTGVTNGISTPDYVIFDVGITPVVGVAKLQWDPTYGTLQFGLAGGNVNLQVGQELVQYCLNSTGEAIPDFSVVYVTGASGNRPTVDLAVATSDATSAAIIGVTTEAIGHNQQGYVTTDGMIHNVDTSALTEGAPVWLSPTTPGGMTTTKPTAPNHLVLVGYCIRQHATVGKLYVKVQNGYEVDELHDVKITGTPTAGSLLIRNATDALWENARLTAGTGVSIANADKSITITNSAPDQVVSLTAGANVTITGTYPSFTIASTGGGGGGGSGTVTSVDLTAGTGISVSGGPITTAGSITVTNTAPDQVVSLTAGANVTVTGTYPNFTIASSGGASGVTSFNTRTGAVTLTSGDVTDALTYTPLNKAGDSMTGPLTLATTSRSSAAWTTAGINLIQSAATFTDTTSTGTVPNVYMNAFGAQTMAATNAITATNLYGTYFATPVAGTNVTASNIWSVGVEALRIVNTLSCGGSASVSGSLNFYGPTTTTTASLATATTASGSTKTVNIGTGGASGSTTAITIGSSTSGATSTTVLNGNVGIGSAGPTAGFYNTKGITGGSTAWANYTNATVQSDVTSQANGYQTTVGTAAATFTVNNLCHFRAGQGTFGAGSTVSSQSGFYSNAANIDATNNHAFYADDTAAVTTGKTAYGFRSAINIATGGGTTYQMYMGGTAPSIVRGSLTIAGTNFSAAAWTTNGIGLIQAATTYTDTTTAASGTVATAYMNRFGAQTYAATNTGVTVTNLYGTYFTAPTAGANVTATNAYALATDNFYCAGTNFTLGSFQNNSGSFISQTTGGVSANFAAGTTASGSTKTVNIGTNGASGSTTNITLGSATSGATQTTTVNGRVTFAPIGASVAAWTTSGVALTQSAATWTDTTSTGTVADVRINNFAAQTLAASNATTVTRLFGTYFTAPAAGTNVTATATYGMGADSIWTSGAAVIGGNMTVAGFISVTGGTGTTTHSIGTATTSTGNTKTVNIGTGGASGSTTNVTIGSNTSGATSKIALYGTMYASLPTTVSTATYTVLDSDVTLLFTAAGGGNIVLTLPAAASYTGRILTLTLQVSRSVVSASSNVVPMGTTTPGTALLASSANGAFAVIQSDGTNWIMIMSGKP